MSDYQCTTVSNPNFMMNSLLDLSTSSKQTPGYSPEYHTQTWSGSTNQIPLSVHSQVGPVSILTGEQSNSFCETKNIYQNTSMLTNDNSEQKYNKIRYFNPHNQHHISTIDYPMQLPQQQLGSMAPYMYSTPSIDLYSDCTSKYDRPQPQQIDVMSTVAFSNMCKSQSQLNVYKCERAENYTQDSSVSRCPTELSQHSMIDTSGKSSDTEPMSSISQWTTQPIASSDLVSSSNSDKIQKQENSLQESKEENIQGNFISVRGT